MLVAEELLDDPEIHQRRGVIGLENIFIEELAVQRREIDAVESELREFRDAQRLVRRLLPPKRRRRLARIDRSCGTHLVGG